MEKKWTRSETRTGIPYYINHEEELTQWDHPAYVAALDNLCTLDEIYYGAYRTAAKMRTFQKLLHMDVVNLVTVRMSFELHGYSHEDSMLDTVQLYDIIHQLFHLTKLRGRSTLCVSRCTHLMLNWILNCYDTQRTGCIPVLPVKLGIATMCAARVTDKYRYFQELLADGSGRITWKILSEFMHSMVQILDTFGESTTFGKSVQPSVEDCFQNTVGTSISQDELQQWLVSEPQTLVWLPTFHRYSTAETMKHEAKCNTCKMYPIIGLRYHCLKCFNMDLCQQCFFTRRVTQQHKHGHPMQEYCLSSKSKEDMQALTKTLRNNLSKKHGRQIKTKYRRIEDMWDWNRDKDQASEKDSKMETHVRLSQMADRIKAVEAMQAPSLDPGPMRDNSSTQTSIKSNRPSIVTATSDDSRYLERRELEDLIDALERENDELIDDLEHMALPFQDDNSSNSKPERKHHGYQGNSAALAEPRNEVLARNEILEEHSRQLEQQLKQLGRMATKNHVHDFDPEPLNSALPQKPVYQGSILNVPDHMSRESSQHISHDSSGYDASSGYGRAAQRLPPYGQSHQALDTIASQSSRSSNDDSKMPRFIGLGIDGTDGHLNQGSYPAMPGTYNNYRQTLKDESRKGDHIDMGRNIIHNISGTQQNNGPGPMYGHLDGYSFTRSQSHGYPTVGAHSQHLQARSSGPGNGLLSSVYSDRQPAALYLHHTMAPTNQAGHKNNPSDPSYLPQDPLHLSALHRGQSPLLETQSGLSRLQDESQSSRSVLHQSSAADLLLHQPPPRGSQFDKTRALESILDWHHFLPGLDEQSTVHFPTLATSQVYPPESYELDELVQRVTEAIPLHHTPLAQESDEPGRTMEEILDPKPRHQRGRRGEKSDIFSAASRIGEAMSSLVTRISIADS